MSDGAVRQILSRRRVFCRGFGERIQKRCCLAQNLLKNYITIQMISFKMHRIRRSGPWRFVAARLSMTAPVAPFEGVFVWDDAVSDPRPGIIIVHNVMGVKAFEIDKAKALASLGYVAFVADIYGKGQRPADREAAFALGIEAGRDRHVLQGRMLASLAAIRDQSETDTAHIAAIGYCFGGKCVLDLARSGADVDGLRASMEPMIGRLSLMPIQFARRCWCCTGGMNPSVRRTRPSR